MTAATVRNISVVVGSTTPIGVIYPTLAAGVEYEVRRLRQCHGCIATFVTAAQDCQIYCGRCRARGLKPEVGWTETKQLQARGTPTVFADELATPRRKRHAVVPWRKRLSDAFKERGTLTAGDIRKLCYMSVQRMASILKREGVTVVRLAEGEYALAD